MRLANTRYWTSTSAVEHTDPASVYGGADINAAYVVYHPFGSASLAGKKKSIAPYMRNARPILTIYK
jgi:hypothetical protein